MFSAIDEIYEAVADEAAYSRVPAVLAQATGARSAIMLELDENMVAQDYVRHAVSDSIMDRYVALDLWQHDLWSHLMARPGYRNRATRSDEVLDVDAFRDSVFCNELYLPLGDDTARCLGVVLDREGGCLAIGLHRADRQPVYDGADAAALQDLIPHLRRLVAARGRLRKAEKRAGMLAAAFDELPTALMILTPTAQLRHANRAAEDLIRARSGLMLQRGRVSPTDPRMAARFAEAVRSAAAGSGSRGGAMRLPYVGGSPLKTLVVPMNGPLPGALLLVDEDRAESFTRVLAGLYDLTIGEAQVADLLAQGLSPEETAHARGVRLSTVRTQILNLIHKTEARGLGDLLRTFGRISRLTRGPSYRDQAGHDQ